ncbi:MAG: amidase [Acidobacteria bacterium]|nr:amidase [Acidobacteriota bacterium]
MAKVPDDVFFATIPQLNARLKAREFSAEDLARAFSERLQTLAPRYNALALSLHQEAIRAARDVDKDLKRERYRGPLQGIPYGVKDLLAFAGQPTTWGAAPYAAQVFDYNAAVIDRFAGIGAILAGKLSMVELAGGGGYRYPSASFTGPGLNPWDRTRWSGGSSSGSAAAVAAGLLPFAIGSETSGSIVTPASYCGVTALRPTYGLVSRYGAMALSWTLDKLGPFARTAEDCGLILQAMAGKDSRDPGSAGKSFYYTPQYARPLKDLKAGYSPADFDGVQETARPAFAAALDALRQLGLQLVETRLPDFPYGAVLSTILNGEMGAIFEPLIAAGKVDELADKPQIAGLKASLDLSAKDYLKAMRIRRLIQDEISKLFTSVDILVAPGRANIATKIDQRVDVQPPGMPPPPKDPGMRAIIPMGNLAGLPALALPCGFAENMPVALQLVGVPFSENQLLAVGREFQAKTDWHTRRPPGA